MVSATLTADFGPHMRAISRAHIDGLLQGAKASGQDRCVAALAFHPYEIVDAATLRIDPAGLQKLDDTIAILRDEYGAELVSADQCAARIQA